MALMSPTDSMFLIGESREQPMHVGSLQVFELPDGADADLLRVTLHDMLQQDDVAPLFRRRPYRSLTTLGQWGWTDDADVDLEHHVRHSALPQPGRVRDLLELVSRLHGTLLDRHRPLWEVHLIEGLHDGRYAVYTKFHHSLMDGVSALRLTQRAFSTDPADEEVRVPWSLGPRKRPESRRRPSLVAQLGNTVGSVASLGPSTIKLARAALLEQQLTLPFRAPRTMFNVRIGGARRVAAQSWSLDRIKAVKSAAGGTVNDVVLAMSAGALRAYLIEQNALPDDPLIAMVPVNLRKDDDDGGGNMVGTFLCNLATDVDDPGERLETISGSMRDTKDVFKQ